MPVQNPRYIRAVTSVLLLLVAACAGPGKSLEDGNLSEVERLLIERECERLAVLYTHHVDFGNAERIAELFVEEGVWDGGQDRFEGRPAIREFFRRRQEQTGRTSRHVISNLLIEVLDREHAKGTVYIQLFRHDGNPEQRVRPLEQQPIFMGEYYDDYVRTPQGWRFSRRKAGGAFARNAE